MYFVVVFKTMYVCQTWVKYLLQISSGVCFNFLEVPDVRIAAG